MTFISFLEQVLCKVDQRPRQSQLLPGVVGVACMTSSWMMPLPKLLTGRGSLQAQGVQAVALSFPASAKNQLKPGGEGEEGKGFLLALQPAAALPHVRMEMVPEGAPVLLQNCILLSCEQRQNSSLSFM